MNLEVIFSRGGQGWEYGMGAMIMKPNQGHNKQKWGSDGALLQVIPSQFWM